MRGKLEERTRERVKSCRALNSQFYDHLRLWTGCDTGISALGRIANRPAAIT